MTTASLVLSGKGRDLRISADVEARVREAAAELDYTPNLLVRSLQRGRTHVVSFFDGYRQRRQGDLYMDRLSTAIQRAAGRLGYDVLVHCDFERPVEETYYSINGGRADGALLFAPRRNDPLLPYLRASRLPVVLLMRKDEEGALSSVVDDMDSGMRQLAGLLVEQGHRRVAALTHQPGGNPEAEERTQLLRQYLAEAGVIIPERWIVPTHHGGSDYREKAVRFLLDEPEPPTAIFCWHDLLAYGVLEILERHRVAVPEQVSIVGYDGLHWPAATRHQVESIHVDLDLMADAAVEALDRLIRGVERAPVCQTFPVHIAPGTTLAPPGAV